VADAEQTREGTVARAVLLLERIVLSDDESGVRAIARDTSIDKSAVSRLLQQLAELRILETGSLPGRYRIGPRLFALSRAVVARDEVGAAARPILDRLVARFDETCYLTVREGDVVVFREKVDCRQPIRYVIELDRPSPLHAGAAGRAVLAALPEAELDAYLRRGPLQAITDKTITDTDELRRRASNDRDQGYTASVEERNVGGAGVAAPYFGRDGRCLGSIVLTVPVTRYRQEMASTFGPVVAEAAAELTTRLGAARWLR
jgi:DNA-binding IclR family transcriptional regulator